MALRMEEALEGRLLIGGSWVTAHRGDVLDDVNPATGETLATVGAGQAEDIERAVSTALRAFRTAKWARTNPTERGRVLVRIGALIREHLDELAELEARDVGKLLPDARGEIELCASLFEYYGGAANKVLGEVYPAGEAKLAYTLRQPLGVVAAITPWNYPLPLATLKVAPALCMGNAVVLKPAEQAPLTALALGNLALEAGLPPGLLNVVTGLGEVAGEALIHHPDVAMIAFTGSTEIGRRIMRAAAERIAKFELELGGKSPQVVFADADLDQVVSNVAMGLFKNAGQDCCAGSRILVQEKIYSELLDRLRTVAEGQRLGDPLKAGTTMGPLISEVQRQRVAGYEDAAVGDGAHIVTGGKEARDGYPARTSFYRPTLLTKIDPDARIFQEEVFGPVGVVVPFSTEEEAVRLANHTKYGLAAAVWTKDIDVAHRTAAQIDAGMVWINEYYAHVMEMPFGGFKQSGTGKDYSMHALEAYSQVKEIVVRLH